MNLIKRQSVFLKYIFLYIFIVLITIYTYPILSSWFWLVDDHEIFAILGSNDNCSIGNYFSMLSNIDEFSRQTTRFRPIYYLIRTLETSLWCVNSLAWFTSHLIIYTFAVFITILPFYRLFGFLFSLIAVLYVVSMPFFVDVLPRLAPQELYCFFGLSIFILIMFHKIYFDKEKHNIEILLPIIWALSSILCIGSKEQFIFLIPISTILVYIILRKNNLKDSLGWVISFFLQLFFGMYILLELITRLSKNSEDIYGQSINFTERLVNSITNLDKTINISFILLFFLLAALFIRYLNTKIREEKNFVIILILVGFLIMYVLFVNVFFYQGGISYTSRYAFPSIFLILIYFLYVCSFNFQYKLIKYKKNFLLILATITLVTFFYNSYLSRKYVKVNISKRDNIYSQLEYIKNNNLTSDDIIAINFSSRYSYEPLYSVRTLLKFYNIKAKLVVTYYGNSYEISEHLFDTSNKGMPKTPNYSMVLDEILPNGMSICEKKTCFKFEISEGY